MPASDTAWNCESCKVCIMKTVAREDIIFSEYFRALLIYPQFVIFIDKFYQFFYSMRVFEIWKETNSLVG